MTNLQQPTPLGPESEAPLNEIIESLPPDARLQFEFIKASIVLRQTQIALAGVRHDLETLKASTKTDVVSDVPSQTA